MNKLEELYQQLENNRDPGSDDPYHRPYHGTLLYTKPNDNAVHKFEVRGFKKEGDKLKLSVVNWTMCAGTATLTVSDKNVGQWRYRE
jgi:hypothetical protein